MHSLRFRLNLSMLACLKMFDSILIASQHNSQMPISSYKYVAMDTGAKFSHDDTWDASVLLSMRIWEPFPHATEFLNPAIKQLPLCHCGNRICVLELHSLLLPLLLLPTSLTSNPQDSGAFSGHNWKKKPWNDAEGTPHDMYQLAHPHLCCLTSFQCYLSRHGHDHTRTRLTQIPCQVGILKV